MGDSGQDFRFLFEACPHPYLVLRADDAYTIVAVNDRYLAATGTSRPDILGLGLFEVFPDNPDDPACSAVRDLRTSLERVVRDRRPDIMGVQKYDIPRRDGSGGFEVKYWSPVNTPAFDARGDIACIIHHVEDVTDFILTREHAARENSEKIARVEERADRMEAEVLRRAGEVKEANRRLKTAMEKLEKREKELARLNEELKSLDRSKTAFFSNVSHEFRTPLTLILAPLEDELAETGGTLPPDRRERLETVYRNSLRLLKLVNTLLDFSRIEAGRTRAFYEPTDLAGLTSDLVSNFRSVCERAGLWLRVDCPPLPDPVQVDRTMWEKIVLNLISNAFKFTMEGGISVDLAPRNGFVELTVIDTGVGMPADELPRVFDRFHRVKGVEGRTHEGSGIGLALVRELVRLHGGDIRVESAQGKGSRFMVSLPKGEDRLPTGQGDVASPLASTALGAKPFVEEASRWTASGIPAPSPGGLHRFDAPPSPTSPSGGDPLPRVVWADDNADMRDYVRRLMSGRYEMLAFADGEEALAAARRDPPDLVLTDVMMPRLDGFGLLRELRADEALQGVPVILLSARAGEEAMVEGLTAGADDYIVKPFSARELLTRVEACLNLAAMRKEAARREAALAAIRSAKALLEQSLEEQRRANESLNREIAQRMAVERELGRAKEEAESANRAKSDFLANMSHEIRTPLNGILGFAELGQMTASDSETREYLGYIKQSGESLLAIINDILDFSKIEAGRMDLHIGELDPGHVVETTLRPLFLTASEKGLALRWAVDPDVPDRLLGDQGKLRQVLTNLIGNAIKYTEHGRIALRVDRMAPAAPANAGAGADVLLRFRIQDTGIGISAENQKNIFKSFSQVGTSSHVKYGGTGLGLAISKQLAELMGGAIWVESEPGKGSTFCFTARFTPVDQKALATPQAQPDAPEVVESFSILVAEDNPVNQAWAKALLGKRGYRVAVAENGKEALEKLKEQNFDLVLMDVRMPVMTGVEATEIIRRGEIEGIDPAVPIIALTAHAMKEDRERFLAAGMDEHLAKPVDLEALDQAIRAIFRKRRPLQ